MDALQTFQNSIPEDIALNIASSLEVTDLCALGCCSRFWREPCGSDHIWQSLVRDRWPFFGFSDEESPVGFGAQKQEKYGNSVDRKPDVTCMPLWVKFRDLPRELITREGMSYVASGVGRLICLDEATKERGGIIYARALVLMDVKSKFHKTINIKFESGDNIFKVRVEYPWEPEKCGHCLMVLGHSSEHCFKAVKQERVPRMSEGAKRLNDLGFIKDQNTQRAVDVPEIEKLDQLADCQTCQSPVEEWKRFYVMQHKEMARRASSVIRFVSRSSPSNSLEVDDYLQAMEDVSSLQLWFLDVEMFLFKPQLSVFVNLIGLHHCIRLLKAPTQPVVDALHRSKISGRRVCVKWWKVGRWFHGFNRRGATRSRLVSLVDIATGKEQRVLDVLHGGVGGEVLGVRVSVANPMTTASTSYSNTASPSNSCLS